jgi:hypothetical protein
MMPAWLHRGVDWAGLAAGPGAWAISTQTNYGIAEVMCRFKLNIVPVLALVLVLAALAGAALSWRAWRVANARDELLGQEDGRPRAFLAFTGAVVGVLFAAVIATQGAAGLILSGCER